MSVFRHSLAKMEIVMLGCTAIAFHWSLVDVRYTRTFSFPYYELTEDNQKSVEVELTGDIPHEADPRVSWENK
jgi:hypothetical protein